MTLQAFVMTVRNFHLYALFQGPVQSLDTQMVQALPDRSKINLLLLHNKFASTIIHYSPFFNSIPLVQITVRQLQNSKSHLCLVQCGQEVSHRHLPFMSDIHAPHIRRPKPHLLNQCLKGSLRLLTLLAPPSEKSVLSRFQLIMC